MKIKIDWDDTVIFFVKKDGWKRKIYKGIITLKEFFDNHYKEKLFDNYENHYEIFDLLKNYPNITDRYCEHLQNGGDEAFFKKLGIEFGKKVWFDEGGNLFDLSIEDSKKETGSFRDDVNYFQFVCLRDCDEDELEMVIENCDWEEVVGYAKKKLRKMKN